MKTRSWLLLGVLLSLFGLAPRVAGARPTGESNVTGEARPEPVILELEKMIPDSGRAPLPFDQLDPIPEEIAKPELSQPVPAGPETESLPDSHLDNPPVIVLSERSTGCQTVVADGSASRSAHCQGLAPYSASNFDSANPLNFSQTLPVVPGQPQSVGVSFLPPTTIFNLQDYYARTIRPQRRPGNGDRSWLYPLDVTSPITSHFGWRIHPIFQDWRLHSGSDLGAALGTPVVAVLSGRIRVADWLGGYGLTVVIEHDDQYQTLYAHLSEIFVRPGERIQQGEILGRVGSTGNSTGPHLHFEIRTRTEQGWIAVNPHEAITAASQGTSFSSTQPTASPGVATPSSRQTRTLLEYRVSQLLESLQIQ